MELPRSWCNILILTNGLMTFKNVNVHAQKQTQENSEKMFGIPEWIQNRTYVSGRDCLKSNLGRRRYTGHILWQLGNMFLHLDKVHYRKHQWLQNKQQFDISPSHPLNLWAYTPSTPLKTHPHTHQYPPNTNTINQFTKFNTDLQHLHILVQN